MYLKPDIRLAIINAVLKDVSTKRDIEELRKEMKEEIQELRKEMNSNFKWTIGIIITVWAATVIPILLKLIDLL